jgi:hypothetical protein
MIILMGEDDDWTPALPYPTLPVHLELLTIAA